jgi:anti-sigma B factor antagonist
MPERVSARLPAGIDRLVLDRAGVQRDHDFSLDVERVGDVRVVSVGGDVDLYSAPALRDRLGQLAAEGVPRVVVDLSKAGFLDSMALGVLLSSKKRLVAAGADLVLVVPTPELRRIFEITMLDRVFALHERREAALDGARQSESASASEE